MQACDGTYNKGFRNEQPGIVMRAGVHYCWRSALVAMRVAALFQGLATARAGEPAFDFSHRVVPILRTHCVSCHGGLRHEGDYSLNTRESATEGGAVDPGHSASSHLIELVSSEDPDERMPKEKPPLSAHDIDTLKEWIDAGLPWEPGFTFAISDYEPPLRPRRPELPAAVDGRTHPIDRLIDAYLAKHDVG